MKFAIRYGLFVLVAVIGLVFAGCATTRGNVTIRSDHNLTSVIQGGTITFRATGKDIIWNVSSTSDGSGRVSERTTISQNGLLSVSTNETLTNLYVIATSAHNGRSAEIRVRVVTVTNVSVSAASQNVAIGRTLQFRAQVTGTNNPDQVVTWRVSSNAQGTGSVTAGTSIGSGGLLTVSANESLRTLYVIATSIVDSSKSGNTSINVVVPTVTSVTVNPQGQSVRAGSTQQFTASVLGTFDPVTTVTWSVSSNAAGTGAVTPGTRISNTGMLTVAPNESLSTLYIIATSTYDTTKSGSVAVSVVIPIVTQVNVSSQSNSVNAGRTLQFNAAVTGVNNPSTAVTWRVSSNAAGSGPVASGTAINANGLLTVASNETSRTLFIIATSSFDPSKSGSISVAVIFPTVTGVNVTSQNTFVTAGQAIQFHASVTGTNNPDTSVTWRVSSNAAGTGAVTQGTRIDNNGLLIVAANETARTLFIIATSVFDRTRTGSISISVIVPATPPTTTPPTTTPPTTTPPVSTTPTVTGVTITPSTVTTQTNRTVQLRANVNGTNNPSTDVTWRVSSTADGTGAVAPNTRVSAGGLLNVAPNEWNPTLYVFATSAVDTTKTGVAVVTVSNNNPNQGPNQGQGGQ